MAITASVQGNAISVNGACKLLIDPAVHVIARTNGNEDNCGSYVNIQVMSGAIATLVNIENGVIQVLPADATEIISGLIETEVTPVSRQIWNPLHRAAALPDPAIKRYGVIGSNPNGASSVMIV